MAKINVDCGKKFKYPGGQISELPDACRSRQLRESLFRGASMAFEELGEKVDMVDTVKLSHNLYLTEGYRTTIRVSIFDPLLGIDDPDERETVAEESFLIAGTSEETIAKTVVMLFWKCVGKRSAEIERLYHAFGQLPPSPAPVQVRTLTAA